MYTGKWVAAGKMPDRMTVVAMLREEVPDSKVAAMAVHQIEKDALIISDLRNRVDGMKIQIADLKKRVALLEMMNEVSTTKRGVFVGRDEKT